MLKPVLWVLAAVVFAGCSQSGNCPDCCPAGDPGTEPFEIRCRIVGADGWPIIGASARCTQADAGAVSDSIGAFAIGSTIRTCGIAAGNVACGNVQIIEDGGVLRVTLRGTDAGETEVSSALLTGDGCLLTGG